MSYLTQYTLSCPTAARPDRLGVRVDERTLLNRPAFDGGAHVRVFVEDTSNRKLRRPLPSPRLRMRIADCANQVNLEFSVDTAELRAGAARLSELRVRGFDSRAGAALR